MTLKADLGAMADAIALPDSDLHKRIEVALHAAVKLLKTLIRMYPTRKHVTLRRKRELFW